ncbi:hypothetical protein B0J11DRAFT_496496 [Dendryphion nanum]|uniref:Uncharacterized protein n=1 Tax=Dendryphion nanum TaxID=256645 RepID=A0A9P9D8A9_9PLEO|nr:hypothetical protein B0J11DRAFT_496496 [Dendryphion nanum]
MSFGIVTNFNMDHGKPSLSGAFNKLPIELNQLVAHNLDLDSDIIHFGLACKEAHNAIWQDRYSFWRIRFREKYDLPQDMVDNRAIVILYRDRAWIFNKGITVKFEYGRTRKEIKVIEALKGLILESFKGSKRKCNDNGHCLNQQAIVKFLLASRYFMNIRELPSPNSEMPVSEVLGAIRIMCAQLMLEMDGPRYDILSFDDSQKLVYSHWRTEPIFYGHSTLHVNMKWVLHCLNFFRHHMIKEEAGTLRSTMIDQEDSQKPTAWRSIVEESSHASAVSRHWKGTYAFIDPRELQQLRSRRNNDDSIFVDQNIDQGEKSIQELTLDCVKTGELPWPTYFENRLQSLKGTMPPRTRAQHRAPRVDGKENVSIRLSGEGRDQGDDFFASGWLNPLVPQGSIAGWQRVTFMKHFEDLDQATTDDLWAYEGVVLPGGRIMVGRWWYASGDCKSLDWGDNSGPFILWAVEAPPVVESDDHDDDNE